MKIIIILYIIGIIVYWLGILNFAHVAKRTGIISMEALKTMQENARKPLVVLP